MKKSLPPDHKEMLDRIIGVSKSSHKKSYYPQLQEQIAKLEKSEQNYRFLFENMFDGLLVCQAEYSNGNKIPDLKIIDVNSALLKSTNWEKSSLLNTNLSTFFSKNKSLYKNCQTVFRDNIAKNVEEYFKDMDKWFSINIFCPQPDRIAVQFHDITMEKNAEHFLRESLREKETLVKEVHHRVKNNLQIISSLLYLQSRGFKDPIIVNFFKNSQNRIRSMALVHEMIYKSKNFTKINFTDYIKELCYSLQSDMQPTIENLSFQFSMDTVILDLDQAIPACLTLNEIISNSLKYAFKDATNLNNTISLEMAQNNNRVFLTIKDNGIGIDEKGKSSKNLGMKLINSLVISQLDGKLDITASDGTIFNIEFDLKSRSFI